MRFEHPVSFCHMGFGMCELQPLPAPHHVVSAHPRADVDFVRVVLLTDKTYGRFAGFAFCWTLVPSSSVLRP